MFNLANVLNKMSEEKRKFWSRVGAALMLGVGIFGFGVGLKQGEDTTMPRRFRNIRKREQRKTSLEIEKLDKILDEETREAIQKVELEKLQNKASAFEKENFAERLFQYGLIGIWLVSAAVLFGSLIFNFPFALGKGVLSLLPGVPHTGSIYLVVEKTSFDVEEKIKIDLLIDSDGEDFTNFSIKIDVPQEKLVFDRMESSTEELKLSLINRGSFLEIKGEPKTGSLVLNKKKVASFYFDTASVLVDKILTDLVSEKIELSSNFEGSMLVTRKKDGEFNTLGKIVPAKFFIASLQTVEVSCFPITISNLNSDQSWQEFIYGPALKKESAVLSFGMGWSAECFFDGNKKYLVISVQNDELKSFKVEPSELEQNFSQIVSWQNEMNNFYVFSFIQKDKDRMLIDLEGIKNDPAGKTLKFLPTN